MKKLSAAALLLSLVSGFSDAQAAWVSREICLDVEPEYLENDPTNDNLGDFHLALNGEAYPASHFAFAVQAPGSYHAGYLNGIGCATLVVDTAKTYTVKLRGLVRTPESGGHAKAYFYETADVKAAPMWSVISSNWSPASGDFVGLLDVDQDLGLHGWANVALAVRQALANFDGEIISKGAYIFYMEATPKGNDAAVAYANTAGDPLVTGAAVFINTSSFRVQEKYTAAHELGHLMAFKANCVDAGASTCSSQHGELVNYAASNNDPSIPGRCLEPGAGPTASGWIPTSREHSSAAASEGWADFVASNAFTDLSIPTSTVPRGQFAFSLGYFWMGAGVGFSADAADFIGRGESGSSGGAEWSAGGIDARDYLGDHCINGADDNRGAALDWARFWWDSVYTPRENTSIPAVSTGEALSIYASAAPYTWCDDDAVTCGGSNTPAARIETAYTNATKYSNWEKYRSNGIEY